MLRTAPLAAILFIAPLAAQTLTVQPAPGAKASETRTLPLAKGAPLKVRNVNGYIRVTGWDRNEVEFTGAFTPGRGGEQVKAVLEPKAGGLEIRGEYPKDSKNGPACDMDLKVPRSALASLESVNGQVALQDLTGTAECRTVNGEITLERLPGAVRISTVNGAVTGRDLGGPVSARTVNGAIRLSTRGLKGRLKASTVNGGLAVKGAGATDVHLTQRSLAASFGDGDQPLELRTVNGDITLD